MKSMELFFQDVHGAFVFVAGDDRLFLFQQSVCEGDFVGQGGFAATGFDLMGTEVTHVQCFHLFHYGHKVSPLEGFMGKCENFLLH